MALRYVVVGAGAIGSAVGGLLARHGSEVLLVARGAHAEAMSAKGLHIRTPDTTMTVPVPTVTSPEEARLTVDDVLVLTTKTHQSETAVDQWADVPVHDASGAVAGRAADLLPLLTASNGVAGEEIALRYFEHVVAVCVWCPVVMIDPGEVLVRAAGLPHGIFHIGRYGTPPSPQPQSSPPSAAGLPDDLDHEWGAAGLRVVRPESVMSWKYQKLLTNLNNVLQALLGDTTGSEDILRAAEDEAREVFAAAGAALPGAAECRAAWGDLTIRPVPGEPARLGGSSWQSLVRGTGTIETDFLNGEIALMARRTGCAAPVNARLTALARRAAREGHRPGHLDAARLRDLLSTGTPLP